MHMLLQIQDDKLGRQGFATQPRRTIILTAAATRAGIQIEQLFPSEILQLARSEFDPLHRFLITFKGFVEIGDGSQFAFGAEFMKENIYRREDQMTEFRKPNVSEKAKGDDHMKPPPKPVPAQELRFGYPKSPKRGRNGGTYWRPNGPVGMLGEFGGANPCAFDQKPTDEHHDEKAENNEIFTAAVQTHGADDVAAIGEARDTDDAKQPKNIKRDGEKQIKVSVQKLDAHILLHRHHQRADEQDDKARVHEEMEQAGRTFAQGFALPKALDEHGFEATGQIVKPIFRSAAHPPLHVKIQRPTQHAERREHEQIDHFTTNDIAIDFACRRHDASSA